MPEPGVGRTVSGIEAIVLREVIDRVPTAMLDVVFKRQGDDRAVRRKIGQDGSIRNGVPFKIMCIRRTRVSVDPLRWVIGRVGAAISNLVQVRRRRRRANRRADNEHKSNHRRQIPRSTQRV